MTESLAIDEPDGGRLARLFSALSHINQAIARAETLEELLRKVCDALVEHGGFPRASIGWNEAESPRLIREAHSGPEGEYRASADFPIRRGGEVCGTLTVFAREAGFLRDRESAILTEAAADVSFALDELAREDERRRADEVVKRFAAIVESTDDAIISKTLDATIVSWNAGAERMFGFTAAEIVGKPIARLIPPERADDEPTILRRVGSGERIPQFETTRMRRDGTRFPVSITFSPIWSDDGTSAAARTVLGISTIVRDVTERTRTEAAAERERRFATSLIESMPGIFYLYDQEGHFLRWNRNFEVVSGYRGEEIATMHPLDFFAGDDMSLLRERIEEVFELGEAQVEASFVAKSGQATPYYFTGRRISFDGATCLVGVGVDIAERKRAEEALAKTEERYRTTLETMLEGCQLLGFDWRYLYLNPAAAVQNRRPNAELLGKRMQDEWPGIEGTSVFALLRRCMEERVHVREESEFEFPDGAKGWFDVRAQPIPEGVFVLSMDISERKRAETALRELNEGLELKVAERTRELEVAKERAEAADRLKSSFLATMSHELRTPLNSILGFTGILLQGLAGHLNGEQSKQLGMVQGSARHLLDLINDVLDISKIEAGQLQIHPAPVDLADLVAQVTASVRPLAEKKGLHLRLACSPTLPAVETDRRRLEQILINLLNNAVKFTEHGEVTLTVESAEIDSRPVIRLRVSDTGIGMAAKDIATLFQPFRQIDSGIQRQHEGTGLGLAICRRLTELLGGKIGVESTPGRGSVFTVTLPQRPEVIA